VRAALCRPRRTESGVSVLCGRSYVAAPQPYSQVFSWKPMRLSWQAVIGSA